MARSEWDKQFGVRKTSRELIEDYNRELVGKPNNVRLEPSPDIIERSGIDALREPRRKRRKKK